MADTEIEDRMDFNDRDEGRDNDTRGDNDREDNDFVDVIEDADVSDSEGDIDDESIDSSADSDLSESLFDFSAFGSDEDEDEDVRLEYREQEPGVLEKMVQGVKDEVSRQGEQIKNDWNEFTDAWSNTIAKPVKEFGKKIGEGFKEFADEYPITHAIKEGYNTVKEGVSSAIDAAGNFIGDKVVDPIKDFIDKNISQPLDTLNEKLGNANNLPDDLNDLYINPYNTKGAINWHARSNPSAWADDHFFNLGPARLDVMTKDMWDNTTPKDQAYITEHYGTPAIVNSIDEMKDWISDKEHGFIDGSNPLMTRMDVGQALEQMARAQGLTGANVFAMSPTDFESYMSQPVFNIDSIPEDASADDILTLIDGEMARRALLGGTGFWVNKEERGQAKAYQEKIANENGLTYDDLRSLKSAIVESKKAAEDPSVSEKLSGGIASFFMPGASTAAKKQDLAKASFDPKAVLEAAKENNISVSELLKMRSDAINFNNPEKAMNYFKMTGDTLNNPRVIDYIGAIGMALQGVQDGTMDEDSARLLIEHYEKEAIANKASDIWNNDTMNAVKNGALLAAVSAGVGVASKVVIEKGSQAVLNRVLSKVSAGNANRIEKGIYKFITGNKQVKNAARYEAMKDAFEQGLTMESDGERAMLESMLDAAREAGDMDAVRMFERDLANPGLGIAEDLEEILSAIENPETNNWVSGYMRAIGATDTSQVVDAIMRSVSENVDAKKAAAVAGVGAGAIGSASAGARRDPEVSTIEQQAPTGLVEKINTAAEDIPKQGSDELDENGETIETEESFKNSEAAQQVARDLAREMTPGELSNPDTRKEMLDNASRLSGIDYTERAKWLNDLITDSELEDTNRVLDEVKEEEPEVLREIFSFIGDILGASVNPIGMILTFAKELPNVLKMLGFEADVINQLQGIHDKVASQDSAYDSSDYSDRESLGEWGYTGGGNVSKGETANAAQVKSDSRVKKAISHIIRQEPYVRKMVIGWKNDSKSKEK